MQHHIVLITRRTTILPKARSTISCEAILQIFYRKMESHVFYHSIGPSSTLSSSLSYSCCILCNPRLSKVIDPPVKVSLLCSMRRSARRVVGKRSDPSTIVIHDSIASKVGDVDRVGSLLPCTTDCKKLGRGRY